MNKIIKYIKSIIFQKELKAFIHILKEKVFEHNGILFGDIVANIIIQKYYKNLFIKNKNNYNNFWNNNYDKNTILRMQTSNKIDIYFTNSYDYLNFIEYIKTEKSIEIVSIKSIDNSYSVNNLYEIKTVIGKTVTFVGYDINVKLNILFKLPAYKYLVPPFNQTNFLTDILIMSKSKEFRISNNTGIKLIDEMNLIEKSILYTKILQEVCKKNNYILCENNFCNNYIATMTLDYLKNDWNIINSPLIISYNNNNNNINNCYICQYNIENNDEIITINNITKCILHKECCYKYLDQLLEKNKNITCPLRQLINFIETNKNKIICDLIL